MAVENPTIEIHSGDDKRLNYTIDDSAGTPIDITGATFRWALSKRKKGVVETAPRGSPIVEKSTAGGGVVITNGPLGQVRVSLVPADTAALKGEHYQELEMTLGGLVSTVAFGPVDILVDLVE